MGAAPLRGGRPGHEGLPLEGCGLSRGDLRGIRFVDECSLDVVQKSFTVIFACLSAIKTGPVHLFFSSIKKKCDIAVLNLFQSGAPLASKWIPSLPPPYRLFTFSSHRLFHRPQRGRYSSLWEAVP